MSDACEANCAGCIAPAELPRPRIGLASELDNPCMPELPSLLMARGASCSAPPRPCPTLSRLEFCRRELVDDTMELTGPFVAVA